MSWPNNWQQSIVSANVANPAAMNPFLNTNTQSLGYQGMTAEQQLAIQQNWQQWQTYQQQYAQWHAQYGEQYQREMQAKMGMTISLPPVNPPLPAFQQTQPPPPPATPPDTNLLKPSSSSSGDQQSSFSQSKTESQHNNLYQHDQTLQQQYQQINQIEFQSNQQDRQMNQLQPPNESFQLNYQQQQLQQPQNYSYQQSYHQNKSNIENRNDQQFNRNNRGNNNYNQGNNRRGGRWSDKNNDNFDRGNKYNQNRENLSSTTIEKIEHAENNTPSSQIIATEDKDPDELAFDEQFQKWEEEFFNWKKQNHNHPDRKAYREYELKFEECRQKLLERREQMRRRKAEEKDKTFHQPISKQQERYPNQQHSDFLQQIRHKQPQKDSFQEKQNTDQPHEHFQSTAINETEFRKIPCQENFSDKIVSAEKVENIFKSSSSAIPGLDLLPEAEKVVRVQDKEYNDIDEVIDLIEEKQIETEIKDIAPIDNKKKENEEKETRGANLEAISKNINSLLTNPKLISLLSMVSENPNLSAVVNATNLQQLINQTDKSASVTSNVDRPQESAIENQSDSRPSTSNDGNINLNRDDRLHNFENMRNRLNEQIHSDGNQRFDKQSHNEFESSFTPNETRLANNRFTGNDNFNRLNDERIRSDNCSNNLNQMNDRFSNNRFNNNEQFAENRFNNRFNENNDRYDDDRIGNDRFDGSNKDRFGRINQYNNDRFSRPDNLFDDRLDRYSGGNGRPFSAFDNRFDGRSDIRYDLRQDTRFNRGNDRSQDRFDDSDRFSQNSGRFGSDYDRFDSRRSFDRFGHIDDYDQYRGENARGPWSESVRERMWDTDSCNNFRRNNDDIFRPAQVIDYQNMAKQPKIISTKWSNEDVLLPAKVVDYGHARPGGIVNDHIEYLGPIKTFDYGHSSATHNQFDKKPIEKEDNEPENILSHKKKKNSIRKRKNKNKIIESTEVAEYPSKWILVNGHPPRSSLPTKRGKRKKRNGSYLEKKDEIIIENTEERLSVKENYLEGISDDDTNEFDDSDFFDEIPEISTNEIFMVTQSVQRVEESLKSLEHTVSIDNIILNPGRKTRPSKILIIFRGPPGSGKSYMAKLIKDKEVEMGGSQPRILSIDDYFTSESEENRSDYKDMEDQYMVHLMKAFKKTVIGGFFDFIIVDCINQNLNYYSEFYNFGKTYGFMPYTCEMEMNVRLCTERNIHNRSEEDIKKIMKNWVPTPGHYLKLDISSLVDATNAITEVEMEDVSNDALEDEMAKPISQENDNEPQEFGLLKSKWDTDPSEERLARLDGISKPLRHATIEDYLQMDDWAKPIKSSNKRGEKRVRWADIEEKRAQEKMRAIGFVVGQTDWNRMMDPTEGSSALTQTKYIERVRKN